RSATLLARSRAVAVRRPRMERAAFPDRTSPARAPCRRTCLELHRHHGTERQALAVRTRVAVEPAACPGRRRVTHHGRGRARIHDPGSTTPRARAPRAGAALRANLGTARQLPGTRLRAR